MTTLYIGAQYYNLFYVLRQEAQWPLMTQLIEVSPQERANYLLEQIQKLSKTPFQSEVRLALGDWSIADEHLERYIGYFFRAAKENMLREYFEVPTPDQSEMCARFRPNVLPGTVAQIEAEARLLNAEISISIYAYLPRSKITAAYMDPSWMRIYLRSRKLLLETVAEQWADKSTGDEVA